MANDSETSPAAAAASAVDDDSIEDACSICLEPFNSDDPPAVTDCKHEYHLQCILEWSQRSKECPICWRILALKDPGRYLKNYVAKNTIIQTIDYFLVESVSSADKSC